MPVRARRIIYIYMSVEDGENFYVGGGMERISISMRAWRVYLCLWELGEYIYICPRRIERMSMSVGK